MPQQELEALAYNLLLELKRVQNNLSIVEAQILKVKNNVKPQEEKKKK